MFVSIHISLYVVKFSPFVFFLCSGRGSKSRDTPDIKRLSYLSACHACGRLNDSPSTQHTLYCSIRCDMYSSICFPISFLIVTNKINQFLFFPWQSNHFYIKDNFLIPWNTWRTSRGFTTFWSKCQITLKKNTELVMNLESSTICSKHNKYIHN